MLYSSDYNITKAANEALTRSAANEWGRYGITVNCIVPAGDSFAYRVYCSMNPGVHEAITGSIPMRRMGDCEADIAGALLGLVSRNGRFITGQVFYVDGGAWLARPPNQHAPDTDIHAGRHQTATGASSGHGRPDEIMHSQVLDFGSAAKTTLFASDVEKATDGPFQHTA